MNIIYHYKSINISIDSQDIACDWSCIYMPTQQTQSPQNTIHSPIYKIYHKGHVPFVVNQKSEHF